MTSLYDARFDGDLPTGGCYSGDAAFHPDSQSIYFACNEVYKIDLNGQNLVQITEPATHPWGKRQVAVAPDGQRLLSVDSTGIRMFLPDASEVVQVTTTASYSDFHVSGL